MIIAAPFGLTRAAVGGGGALTVESFSSAAVANNDVSNLTVTKPTGVASGDLLLAICSSENRTVSSSNFTNIGNGTIFDVLTKIAGASEPDDYTFSVSGTYTGLHILLVRISSPNTSSPATYVTEIATTSWTTSLLCPDINVSTAGSVVFWLGGRAQTITLSSSNRGSSYYNNNSKTADAFSLLVAKEENVGSGNQTGAVLTLTGGNSHMYGAAIIVNP
jgi:hypothetical protein